MPETQPLSSTSSTWSLADAEEYMDENAEPRPGLPRREWLDEDEPAPQDLSVGDTPVDGPKLQDKPEPQAKPEPPMHDQTGLGIILHCRTEDKPSRSKRVIRVLRKLMKSKSISAL